MEQQDDIKTDSLNDFEFYSQLLNLDDNFREYFFGKGYTNDDIIENPFYITGELVNYLKEKFLNDNFELVGDRVVLNKIIDGINLLYSFNNMKELILTRLIEGFLNDNKEKMQNICVLLRDKNLIDGLKNLYKSWYGRSL